jgi:MraZ protein
MVNLFGTYECMIDAKGRIIVPAPLKRQLTPFAEKGFIVKEGLFFDYLELYVMDEWIRQSEKTDEINQFEKEETEFIIGHHASVKYVEFDSTGRILLAKEHIAYSKISKNVIMTGVGKKIQIWDKATYENTLATIKPGFSTLAQKVMGNKKAPQN